METPTKKLLKKAYRILLDISPNVRITCIDGHIDTKIFVLFQKESSVIKCLVSDEFEGDERQFDVSDLGIDKQLMQEIFDFMITGNFGRESYTVETYFTMLTFFDKCLLVTYVDMITTCVKDRSMQNQIEFLYKYNISNLLVTNAYSKLIVTLRSHIMFKHDRVLLRSASAKYKRPDIDALIYEQICILE